MSCMLRRFCFVSAPLLPRQKRWILTQIKPDKMLVPSQSCVCKYKNHQESPARYAHPPHAGWPELRGGRIGDLGQYPKISNLTVQDDKTHLCLEVQKKNKPKEKPEI